MNKLIRLTFAAAAAAALASALAIAVRAEPANHANRLQATFFETNVSVTNRIADLGVFQLINTGAGSVDGFGAATMTIGVTQDRSVHPCGPGSWTNAAVRRISVEAGVLVIRELAYVCQTASGPVASGTWNVDGASSTGVFAGARGSGDESVDLTTRISRLSGRLHLARNGD
jgi:hypothetical protein